MARVARWALVIGAAVLAAVGCGGPNGTDDEAGMSGSASPAGSVLAARNLEYASHDPDGPWDEHLLDVYATGEGEGLPLVVMFHGAAYDKGGVAYPRLAADLVARGAVVVSADWTDRVPAALLDMGESLDAIVERERQTADELACAIDMAVSLAPSYGADPTRLVLVGHSAGANEASMAGLGPRRAFPGCAAPRADWVPRGLMLWEGDWLVADPAGDWDSFGDDLGTAVLETVAPWQLLGDAPDIPVVLAVTDGSRSSLRRCDDTETVDWLSMRDPDGSIRARLESLGALDDGCIDVGEEADVLASAMSEQGMPATVLALSDPTSSHTHLASADLTRMVDEILVMAEP